MSRRSNKGTLALFLLIFILAFISKIISVAIEIINTAPFLFLVVFLFVIYVYFKKSNIFGFSYSRSVDYYDVQEIQKSISLKNKNGILAELCMEARNFPLCVAHVLKGKKHEWYVVGFSSKGKIKAIYTHKGQNNLSVYTLSDSYLHNVLLEKDCDQLLVLHNHPNGVLSASSLDKKGAKSTAKYMKNKKVKLKEFVCASGSVKQYY